MSDTETSSWGSSIDSDQQSGHTLFGEEWDEMRLENNPTPTTDLFNIKNFSFRHGLLKRNDYVTEEGKTTVRSKTGLKFLCPMSDLKNRNRNYEYDISNTEEHQYDQEKRKRESKTWVDENIMNLMIEEDIHVDNLKEILSGNKTLENEGLEGAYVSLLKYAKVNKHNWFDENDCHDPKLKTAIILALRETERAFFPLTGKLTPLTIEELSSNNPTFKAIKKLDSNPGFRYMPFSEKRDCEDKIFEDAEELIEYWKTYQPKDLENARKYGKILEIPEKLKKEKPDLVEVTERYHHDKLERLQNMKKEAEKTFMPFLEEIDESESYESEYFNNEYYDYGDERSEIERYTNCTEKNSTSSSQDSDKSEASINVIDIVSTDSERESSDDSSTNLSDSSCTNETGIDDFSVKIKD